MPGWARDGANAFPRPPGRLMTANPVLVQVRDWLLERTPEHRLR
jgi:hypothetical protein